MVRKANMSKFSFWTLLLASAALIAGCSDTNVPGARDVNIPAPKNAEERQKGVNSKPDAVTYLPLGQDVLLPSAKGGTPLPPKMVGPYELRGETLAGALQLVLDEVDIPVAFEAESGLTRTITVTNLKGELGSVVDRICSLADLYCAYENGILVVKEEEVFTVSIPPLGGEQQSAFVDNISSTIGNITGRPVVSENGTRTIVYRATQRTSEMVERYLQKLRAGTALVVFETYVWEVSLNAGNSTGINWDNIGAVGKFRIGYSLAGATDPALGTPVSIGLPTMGAVDLAAGDVISFISDYGAVKTISQPQITVLSGSEARLRVADRQNYVASITRSVDEGATSVSTTTDSVDSGFTLEIQSGWDNSTVYGTINILLQEVRDIDTFDDNPDAVVQLPQTTERELQTQVRVRPGDSLVIAGLVREVDNFSENGPGTNSPFFPTSRAAQTQNIELVFLMKPRVIVFTSDMPQSGNAMTHNQDSTIQALQPDAQTVAAPKGSTTMLSPVHGPTYDPETSSLKPLDTKHPVVHPVAAVPDALAPLPESESAGMTGYEPPPSEDSSVEVYETATVPSVPAETLPMTPPAERQADAPVAITPTSSEQEDKNDPSVVVDYDVLKGGQ